MAFKWNLSKLFIARLVNTFFGTQRSRYRLQAKDTLIVSSIYILATLRHKGSSIHLLICNYFVVLDVYHPPQPEADYSELFAITRPRTFLYIFRHFLLNATYSSPSIAMRLLHCRARHKWPSKARYSKYSLSSYIGIPALLSSVLRLETWRLCVILDYGAKLVSHVSWDHNAYLMKSYR